MPDDEVGYGKPPESGKFRKGKSGNPRGRPKGSKNIATLVREHMSEQIVVTLKGKPRRMSKMSAILIQLTNNAVKGDFKAQRELREWAHKFPEVQLEIAEAPTFHELDQDVLAGFLERLNDRPESETASEETSIEHDEQEKGDGHEDK